jgi:hypothetical protein
MKIQFRDRKKEEDENFFKRRQAEFEVKIEKEKQSYLGHPFYSVLTRLSKDTNQYSGMLMFLEEIKKLRDALDVFIKSQES